MVRTPKSISKAQLDCNKHASLSSLSRTRQANRLKDEVYREMLLIEANRPGAEMGLALALLRAIVQSESSSQEREFRNWLKMVCPVGLRMIEITLREQSKCDLEER